MNKLAVFLLALSLFLFIKEAEAKVLPQAKKGQTTMVKSSSGIIVTPRLRADRRALIVYFANLQNTKAVSYSLTYNTRTQREGAMGSVGLASPSTSQELLFGTCSKNVCTYHTGLNNAKLEVSYTTKAGKKYIKRYKIKL